MNECESCFYVGMFTGTLFLLFAQFLKGFIGSFINRVRGKTEARTRLSRDMQGLKGHEVIDRIRTGDNSE